MIRRRQSRSTCLSSRRAAACCPAGAAIGLASRRGREPECGTDHAIAARRDLYLGQAGRACGPGDLPAGVMAMLRRSPNTRSWVRPQTTSAGLPGHRWAAMSDMLSTPPGEVSGSLVKKALRDRK